MNNIDLFRSSIGQLMKAFVNDHFQTIFKIILFAEQINCW